jgi:hypothetical protein
MNKYKAVQRKVIYWPFTLNIELPPLPVEYANSKAHTKITTLKKKKNLYCFLVKREPKILPMNNATNQ